MKHCVNFLIWAITFFSPAIVWAQQQPEKSPEEIAAIEVASLEEELKLSASQTFYVDSILCSNYRGLFDEYEDMKNSGRQNADTYKHVSEKWLNKNLTALKKVLDEQQYIMYLKRIGKGKEYKKGKDGLYYKKDELDLKKKTKSRK